MLIYVFRTDPSVFAELARSYAANLHRVDSDLAQSMINTPISSFSEFGINAAVSMLDTGLCFVNIGPELTASLQAASIYSAAVLNGEFRQSPIEDLYLTIGEIMSTTLETPPPEKLAPQFCGRPLFDAGLNWIILHEYSHVILGHVAHIGDPPNESDGIQLFQDLVKRNQENEFEADRLATRFLIKRLEQEGDPQTPSSAILTIGTVLGMFNVVRTATNCAEPDTEENSTHPLPLRRFEACTELLSKEFDFESVASDFETMKLVWFSNTPTHLAIEVGKVLEKSKR